MSFVLHALQIRKMQCDDMITLHCLIWPSLISMAVTEQFNVGTETWLSIKVSVNHLGQCN